VDRGPGSPLLFGLIAVAMGLVPYLAAVDVIPSDDEDFGAPRWAVPWISLVAFAVPGLFLTAGHFGSSRPAWRVLLAALIPAALAVHAFSEALRRSGVARAAWLAFVAASALLALHFFRRLAGRGGWRWPGSSPRG
jgi:hypothetical protein